MSATSVTLRGRAAALALMVDTCTITRTTGTSTNLQTGAVTPTTSTIYSGVCRVQRLPSGGVARPATVGEAQVYQQPLYVQVPTSVAGVLVDDVVTVTASALDPDLVGRTFWVKELGAKTHATAHRLGVEEVLG
jgi:hypothetical protein